MGRKRGQFILSGTPAAIDRLVQRAREEKEQVAAQGVAMSIGQLAIRRVNLGSGRSDQLASARRLMAWANAEKLNVTVEPNVIIGNPFDYESDPFDYESDPFDYESDPFDYESDSRTYAIPVGTDPATGAEAFWLQKPLVQIGLTNSEGQRLAELEAHQGEGVLVGVFDTLPVGNVTEPWLTLHPMAEPLTAETGRDLSDHGLLIASLIHAIAPKAQVHLYEVMASDGYGDLAALLSGISAFIAMAAGRPAVLNLSLGSLTNDPSPALYDMLKSATDQGMVVCAAAGNRGQSARKESGVPQAQIPAAYPNVIAVSACTLAGTRATYSHRGDLAAPGGEDLGNRGPGDAEDMIGRGASDPAGTVSGYVAMDAGTSFSTPLAAGAAALVAAQLVAEGAALGPTMHTQVFAKLQAGAARTANGEMQTLSTTGLGAGVLSVPGALGIR